MLKGLTTSPKPFLRRVLLENAKQSKFDQSGYIDLYTDEFKQKSEQQTDKSISLTFDFCIKIAYPTSWVGLEEKSIEFLSFEKNIKTLLSGLSLTTKRFTNKNTFKTFLLSSETAKQTKLKTISLTWSMAVNWFTAALLSDYTYYDDGIPYISIPMQTNVKYTHNAGNSNTNPSFLAYVFFLETTAGGADEPSILPHTITSEVIFDGGSIPTQTGFFTISDTFIHKGEIHTLYETEVFGNAQDKDPHTGWPTGDTTPTDLVKQVNLHFGGPGAVWIGPVHMKKALYLPQNDDNYGKLRAMGGSSHNPDNPHPFLDFNIKSNDKIIDFRSVSKIENMFAYSSDIYEKLLAVSSDILYTGGKKKNTIDELVNKKAIVSEAEYAIRPTSRIISETVQSSGAVLTNVTEKDNIHFIFAIDKMMLLKETTKLPGLLDKLAYLSYSYARSLAKNINIIHFEIIRINKTTGENKTLIVGSNDTYFTDFDSVDHLGNNNSKGFKLRNKTNEIKISNKKNISFYEFTDGEIDNSKYDSNTYAYKIVLKFKDPLVAYLTERLNQARQVIKDLDELLFKTDLKMYYASIKKFVSIFDRFQLQLNPDFVSQALKSESDAQVPVTFGFSENELPNSIEAAFPDANEVINEAGEGLNMENLTALLVSLNSYDDLEPIENFQFGLLSGINYYIRNSLKLSSTTPTLIQKVRSLVHLMEFRLTRSLELYTTENVTKKDVGFTTKDYLESTSVKNAGDFIIEFDYTFNSIDLSKAKDHFNWIGGLGSISAASGLKTISVQDYVGAVKHNYNSSILLSDAGKDWFSDDKKFSYSFLPLRSPQMLSLFNNDNKSIVTKDYQTIRKRLYDKITNSDRPVLIPELLSFFGIRFTNDSISNIIDDKMASLSNQLEPPPDNFGMSFDYPAYGSVNDPDYAWQGGSLDNYPIYCASALVDILTTDNQEKFKDITYLRKVYMDIAPEIFLAESPKVFENKDVPFEINLFSVPEKPYINPLMLKSLFNSDGSLKYHNYYWRYITFLGLFGKVNYLEGFKQGRASKELTPTSFNNRNLIKSMNWKPVTTAVLNQLSKGQQLLCYLQLFEGEKFSRLLDQKVIDLFKNYFNYNKYFLISGGYNPAPTIAPEMPLQELTDLPAGMPRALDPADRSQLARARIDLDRSSNTVPTVVIRAEDPADRARLAPISTEFKDPYGGTDWDGDKFS